MPFPDTPFDENFNSNLIIGLNTEEFSTTNLKEEYEKTVKWLCTSPKLTSYRVNTLKDNIAEILEKVQNYIFEVLDPCSVKVEIHPLIPNVIIIYHNFENKARVLEKYSKEVIVDTDCAAAILRGAHVYAPGILAMISGTQIGDKVSVYADSKKKCKKGLQKLYDSDGKIFVANGITKMVRHELFAENLVPSGVAVQITETISGCPSLGDGFLSPGSALLQNLPSVLCAYALEPQPNETILDMCAAPGNKTTHIAELMQNKGNLVAIDKTVKKTAQLKSRCAEFGAKVYIFDADSTKIVDFDNSSRKCIEEGPPFSPQTFDRILLDTPCSVLGKRPQLINKTSEKIIRSYVPLQRKLFKTAVDLLKVNGTLVYSTCTITLAENEGMVAWALRTFDCLELIKPKLSLGGPGWKGISLKEEERQSVQRFGPDQQIDSVGFFFACFIKKCNSKNQLL